MTWDFDSLLAYFSATNEERDQRIDAQLRLITQSLAFATRGELERHESSCANGHALIEDRVRALEQVTTVEVQTALARRNGLLLFIAGCGLLISAIAVTFTILSALGR